MGYYARIYTNSDSAQGVTVRVYSIDYGDFIADVPYDPYATDGTEIYIDSGAVEFVMELDSGYEFYRWAYRVGSLTAQLQYDYDDIYLFYDQEVDIIVRPEATYGGGGGGATVPVFIDFSTDEIDRIRFYYYDASGEEVTSDYIYSPEFLYVQANSWMRIRNLYFADAGLPPVYCTLPDGTEQMVIDENDDWADRDLYVDDWGGTYWFRTGSGGEGGGDTGSMVERHVYINGQRYIPYVGDGNGNMWEYTVYVSE